jgi:hypothetical protein
MQRLRGMAFAGSFVFALPLLGGTSVEAASSCSSLITPAQAAAALGVSEVKGGKGTDVCEWLPSKSTPGSSKTLEISILNAKGYEAYARLPSVPGRFEITPVSGIGNGAMRQTMQGTRTILMVKKGNNYFSVAVGGLPMDQAATAEQTIATQILQNL